MYNHTVNVTAYRYMLTDGNFTQAISSPYVETMGLWAYAIFMSVTMIMTYNKTGSATLPVMVMILQLAFFSAYLPIALSQILGLLVALSVAGVLYQLFSER